MNPQFHLPDEQLAEWARKRLAADLTILMRVARENGAAYCCTVIDEGRGTVAITDPQLRRTWVAATGVLDSGDQSPDQNF